MLRQGFIFIQWNIIKKSSKLDFFKLFIKYFLKKIHHEKLFRDDSKYDLLIPIKYNFEKPKINKGSCIFIHLTKNYNPTQGCIALKKNDLLVLLKLIKPKTKIKIC